MRILITGSNGYLGKRLVKRYGDCHEIYAATHENLDFTDEDNIRAVFESFGPEAVVHCGAISDVGACGRDPEKSLKVNVYGTRNMARVCAEAGAKMIFCSSDQVYAQAAPQMVGRDFYLPHREEVKTEPVPVYGQHKLMAEALCMEENPKSVILRLSWMYDVPDEAERKKGKGVFAENLKTALARGQVFNLDSNTCRGITDCGEVAENMEKAWSLPAGIYNFGSSGTDNVYETVRKVFGRFGKEELVQCGVGGTVQNLLMDTQKAESAGIRFRSTGQGLYEYIKGVTIEKIF